MVEVHGMGKNVRRRGEGDKDESWGRERGGPGLPLMTLIGPLGTFLSLVAFL